jgi:hypothetical protein
MKHKTSYLLTRKWSLRILLAAIAAVTALAQPQLCVGPSWSVPDQSGQPPNWLAGPPPYFNRVDDPRWAYATRVDYNNSEANFRILEGPAPAANFVYLSFQVNLASNSENHVFFGWNSAAAASAMLLDIYQTGGLAHTDDPVAGDLTAQSYKVSAGGTRANNPEGALPAFMANTRIWRNGMSYTVEMQIPKTELSPDGGGVYSLFINMVPGDPTNMALVTYPWPKTVVLPAYPDVPAVANWGKFKSVAFPAGDATCTANFVSLNTFGVRNNGPSNTDGLTIVRTGNNEFFAKVANNTSTPLAANTVNARFRIANWGSATNWTDITGGGAVGNTGVIAVGGVLASDTDDNHFNKDFGGAAGLQQHQCVLVELSSTTGLTFAIDSFYRNMNFDTASVLEREAEISIKGLPPIAPDGRDIYLWIETKNMPASGATPLPATIRTIVPPKEGRVVQPPGGITGANISATRGGGVVLPGIPVDGQPAPFSKPADLEALLEQGRITTDIIEEVIPTYRVHVFHDSGKTWNVKGVQKKLLEPQASFGYYAIHTGDISGWASELVPQGFTLEKLADNFYRIRKVPNDGVIKLIARVTAHETRPNAYWPFPWWVWVLIIIAVILIVWLIRK